MAAWGAGQSSDSKLDREVRPLWQWLLKPIADSTRGIARVDLKRPTFPPPSGNSLFRTRGAWGGSRQGCIDDGATYAPLTRPMRGEGGQFISGAGAARPAVRRYDAGDGVLGTRTGARIKLMRCIDFGWPQQQPQRSQFEDDMQHPHNSFSSSPDQAQPEQQYSAAGVSLPPLLRDQARRFAGRASRAQLQTLEHPMFSFGLGGSFEMDTVDVRAEARLKFQDWLTIKLLPEPSLKVQKSWQLPNTPLALQLRYECPVNALDEFWKPPARLLARLDNNIGSGVHFSPSGLSIDERVFPLGNKTSLRFAGEMLFPRQVPVDEGQKLFDWRVDRLGLKTDW